jgi:ribonuclease HI
MEKLELLTVYCHGACLENEVSHYAGGYSAIITFNSKADESSGSEFNTTRERMELTACAEALEMLYGTDNPVRMYSDSSLIVNCLNKKRYKVWQKNHWKTSNKEPIKNKDLWIRILRLIRNKQITFHNVKDAPDNKWDKKGELAAKDAAEGWSRAEKFVKELIKKGLLFKRDKKSNKYYLDLI